MGALMNIFYHSLGSMLVGVVLTIIGIILMYVLIRLWWRNSTFSIASIAVGIILFFFLSFQSILLCGAITIKSCCDDVEFYVNKLVQDIPSTQAFSTEDSQVILDHISEEWPLVGYYVNMADFQGHTSDTIAEAMSDELRSYMNWFIFRRICWSLLFVVVGAVIVIKTISIRNDSHRNARRVGASSGNRTSVGHPSRRRMTRR